MTTQRRSAALRRRVQRGRVLLRRHGPIAPSRRKRAAIFGGAVAVGPVDTWVTRVRRPPPILTPAISVAFAQTARRLAPAADGVATGMTWGIGYEATHSIIVESAASLVPKERLYHGLVAAYLPAGEHPA